MDVGLITQYVTVGLVLIVLQGLLSADNAMVMAVLVRPLPDEQRKKALFYGLVGALVLRFVAIFFASYLATVWQLQALGAIYLFYVALKGIVESRSHHHSVPGALAPKKESPNFWWTVVKVEFSDLAFAVDSTLAAVAMATTLPAVGGMIGGLNTGQFWVVFFSGIVGLVIMRYFASWFVVLLQKRPGIEEAAFWLVAWVGVKLVVMTLAHPKIAVLHEEVPEGAVWQTIFWAVLLLILVVGWFRGGKEADKSTQHRTQERK
ncbi:TerC family protein [Exiguobacterium flavidum]|uniref:TerC family protein n=1 Tax=Exiguobacterium flavidum TaxID=2184695 RepID=UPI000DF82C23|nr:TerC family protein [Exiguobacterium flavidum]